MELIKMSLEPEVVLSELHTSLKWNKKLPEIDIIPVDKDGALIENDYSSSEEESIKITKSNQHRSNASGGYINPFVYKKNNKKGGKRKSKNTDLFSAKWGCILCSVIAKDKDSLIEHYEIHKTKKNAVSTVAPIKKESEYFNCAVCFQEFTSMKAYEKHFDRKHGERKYTCFICEKFYKDAFQLCLHNFSAHPTGSGDSYHCNICDFQTDARKNLKDHMQSHEDSCLFKCDLCNRGFDNDASLEEHKSMHGSASSFSCDVCGETFPYTRYLDTHRKANHPEIFGDSLSTNECHLCSKSFADKKSLILHIRGHTGENSILCDMCGKRLSSSEHLKQHLRVHTGYKPHICSVCGKGFAKKCNLTLHERVHSGEKPYVCKVCTKAFSQRSTLVIHERYHSGDRPYVCTLCNKGFVAKGLLSVHIKSCTVIPAEYLDDDKSLLGKWECRKCRLWYTSRTALRKHRAEKHTSPKDHLYDFVYNATEDVYVCKTCDYDTPDMVDIEDHVKSHEATYVCLHCKEKFSQPYKYGIHVQSHEGGEFKCPMCDYKNHNRNSLLQHINIVHLHKFLHHCRYCGKGFNDIIAHGEHEHSHEGAKPFVCVVCQKEFVYSRYLLTHQKRNHRVTIEGIPIPNQCPKCGKLFSKASSVQNHLKFHDKEYKTPKSHLCDICGKDFRQKEKLTIHYRVHTGDKPYSCSYCGKSFTKRDYLIMHERVHSGVKPYSCEYCGKCFNQGAPLKIHVRTHTGERPYVCHICSSGFTSRGALNQHLKICKGSFLG